MFSQVFLGFLILLFNSIALGQMKGIYPLQGIEPSPNHLDLQPLAEVIGEAHTVALGEHIHTSGGYYKAKARLIRYLVEEKGFRTLAFESPWGDALAATRFVEHGEGTARDATLKLLPFWHAKEIADLLEWLSEYNKNHPNDKVRFYGFDIQDPWFGFSELRTFVSTHLNEKRESFLPPLSSCVGWNWNSMGDLIRSNVYKSMITHTPITDSSSHGECLAGIKKIHDVANEIRFIDEPGRREIEKLKTVLVALRAYQRQLFYFHDTQMGYAVRDGGMASVFLSLRKLYFPQDKVLIWAANGHIQKNSLSLRQPDWIFYNHRNLGTYLSEIYKRNYVAIGLIGFDVRIAGLTMATAPPPASNSMETWLHSLGKPYLFIKTSELPSSQPIPLSDFMMNPKEQFDGLLYLDQSEARTKL